MVGSLLGAAAAGSVLCCAVWCLTESLSSMSCGPCTMSFSVVSRLLSFCTAQRHAQIEQWEVSDERSGSCHDIPKACEARLTYSGASCARSPSKQR